MDLRAARYYRSCALTIIVAITLSVEPASAKLPAGANSKFFYKNLTKSDDFSEINPRFVEQGQYVVFLVFTGDPDDPQPWDYMLTKADRDGHSIRYSSTRGILDYNVLSDDSGVVVLKAVEPALMGSSDVPYESIEDWELWYINFEKDEEVLLESSMGLPLADGYHILGLIDLPDSRNGEIITYAPAEEHKLRVKRERVDDNWFFSYYVLDDSLYESSIFETESWLSYTDDEWWPSLVWQGRHSLLTLAFESDESSEFPQSEGVFSIVRINLLDQTSEFLHTDLAIGAFPRFSLNPSQTELYFQKCRDGVTELWSLSLDDRAVEQIYSVKGQLGEVRFAADESSVVFTQLAGSNFDIIRLDFDRGNLRQ